MKYLLALILVLPLALLADDNKVLICGVCRNVEAALANFSKNVEELGGAFADYRAIIYENNSSDKTKVRLEEWAEKNSRVILITDTLSKKKLELARTKRIANARNKVLKQAARKIYKGFKYLIMVDMDFKNPWPIAEIIKTIQGPDNWDCVSANGILSSGIYHDRLAYRSKKYPFGPELLPFNFWADLNPLGNSNWFKLQGEDLIAVFSAFGGLAIYKRDCITKFSYSGTVTKKLKAYYEQIIPEISMHNPQLTKYIALHKQDPSRVRIVFQKNCSEWQAEDDDSIACCEHVTLHAAMAQKGYKRFYINPKMIMRY